MRWCACAWVWAWLGVWLGAGVVEKVVEEIEGTEVGKEGVETAPHATNPASTLTPTTPMSISGAFALVDLDRLSDCPKNSDKVGDPARLDSTVGGAD